MLTLTDFNSYGIIRLSDGTVWLAAPQVRSILANWPRGALVEVNRGKTADRRYPYLLTVASRTECIEVMWFARTPEDDQS